MLTPADVENKQFKTTRLRAGYDPDEVDDFLDRVVEDWSRDADAQGKVIDGLDRELKAARRPVPQDADEPSLKMVKQMLLAAERAADQKIAEATAEATKMMIDAQKQANEVIAKGHEDRQAEIDRMDSRLYDLQRACDDMQQQKTAYTEWARALLTSLEGEPQ